MFLCSQCKRPAYLIRNLCADCAPGLHENRRLWREHIAQVEAEFTRATGKTALQDWYAFEVYLDRHSEGAPPLIAEGE